MACGSSGRRTLLGVSIGGLAASAIAKKFNVEFVVLDRTMSSLTAVAEHAYGGWARNALYFANIDCDVLANYMAISRDIRKTEINGW